MINGMSECTHFEKSCCVYILHGVAAYILGGAIKNFLGISKQICLQTSLRNIVVVQANQFTKWKGQQISKSLFMQKKLLRNLKNPYLHPLIHQFFKLDCKISFDWWTKETSFPGQLVVAPQQRSFYGYFGASINFVGLLRGN